MQTANYSRRVIYKNSALSVACKVIGTALSFVSAPLLLQGLGENKYGVFAAVLSLISWIYYFDLGIGNGLRNKIAASIATNDVEDTQKNISVAYVIVFAMSMAIFAVVFILLKSVNISGFLNIDLVDEDIELILLLAALIACINFVLALINSVLYALHKAGLISVFSVITQALFVVGLFFYVQWGKPLILIVALVEGLSQLIKNVIVSLYVYGKYPQLKPSVKTVDYSNAKGIVSFGLQMFALQIAALILNSTDNIIILKLYGGEAVTPYSLCYRYFSVINVLFSVALTPLWSAYTAAHAKKDSKWIKMTLLKTLILFVFVMIAIIIASIVFEPFMRLWLQRELSFQKGLVEFTTLYFILLMFLHVFSTILNGLGKVKEATIAVIVQAIVNIPISLFLAVKLNLGVNGVILGSIGSMLISLVVYPYITFRELKKMET